MAITSRPSPRRPGLEGGNITEEDSAGARQLAEWAIAGARDETAVQELPPLDKIEPPKPGSLQSTADAPHTAGSRDETAVQELPPLDKIEPKKPGAPQPTADAPYSGRPSAEPPRRTPRPGVSEARPRHDSPPPLAHSSRGYAVSSPNDLTPPPGPLPGAAATPGAHQAVSKPVVADDGIQTSEIPVVRDPNQADPVAMRGAYSRAESRQERSEADATPAANPLAQRRFAIVVGGVIAVLVFAALYKIISSVGDEPTEAELKLLYPYGFTGAKSARGEVAPPASAVRFYFKGKEPCSENGGPKVCLLYEYTCGDFFGTMLLKNTSTGWQRVSDEGMPFRPVTGSNRR